MRQSPRALAAALTGALALLVACGESEPPPPPPLEIPVAGVIQRDQPIELELVGETRGSADVPIRARVEGFLESVHFVEGRLVEKGQLLYTIDPQPFEAKVVEIEGYLAEANTRVAKAKADLDRIRPLAEMHAVSQQDLDSAVAQYEAALGSLQAAEAQLQQAKIQLGYTRIHAPLAGRIGISQAEVGEFVGKAGDTLLNYISKTDPIRVRFAIDERNYLRIARRIRDTEEEPERAAGLELILADGTIHEHHGHTVATDASINPETGTFTLEADFPNPGDIVLAGQFARVRAVIATVEGALLVPARAIAEMQGNFRVFVVGADGTVALRPVELGPKIGRLQIVTSGVAVGETIALEGLQKLKDGMVVAARPVALDAEGDPVKPPAPAEATKPADAEAS